MSDKPKTTSISLRDVEVNMDYSRCYIEFNGEEKEYTLVHNNPDYHVIKKSDVDGDVDKLIKLLQLGSKNENGHITLWLSENHRDLIVNALIAQSKDMEFRGKCRGCDQEIYIRNGFMEADPDMVRIPRKVLLGMKVKVAPGLPDQHIIAKMNRAFESGRNQTIDEILTLLEQPNEQ